MNGNNNTPSQLALVALQRAKARILALEAEKYEPIAIVGMACRFPGGSTPEGFFNSLLRGEDAVREIPLDRLHDSLGEAPSPPPRAGLLDDVGRFDAEFFSLSAEEASAIDPQQRLLLEVSWEALEDAGHPPEQLPGSSTGVFIGITAQEYLLRLLRADASTLSTHVLTGNGNCFAAGRLSYTLGLQGPSLAVDTACSSSLMAVHLACQSLRSGESSLALAGGVNLLLSSITTRLLAKAGVQAADGRCKTFDTQADGFVRGEGCGIVVLKRLSQALEDGDRIYALLRGSAANQDGRSTSLTSPNVLSQQTLLREALRRARVTPEQIGYIETHGAGTAIGDPIEVDALKAIIGKPRDTGVPCHLGAVKTNVGHLEAAAGVAGLIKVALAMKQQIIPGNLHFQNLNPLISLDGTPFRIPTNPVPWPSGGMPRLAGVSSFGLSGTNVHVILEEAPTVPPTPAEERSPHLLTLSAHTGTALATRAAQLARHLAEAPNDRLADVCCSANSGRGHFAHRVALLVTSREQMAHDLGTLATGSTPKSAVYGDANGPRAKLAFLFSGAGVHYTGMGRGLYEAEPVFRSTVDHCAELLAPHMRASIVDVFRASGSRAPSLDEMDVQQPALFVLAVALAELWRSWGIVPDVVIGHSAGELAAAFVAGVISLEDGLRLIAARGRLMHELPARGRMISIQASEPEVAERVASHARWVAIAAVNGPDQIVISGEPSRVESIAASFEREGVRTTRLEVPQAGHSPLVEPMLDAFDAVARTVRYAPPRIPIVSNVDGRLITDAVLDAAYWIRHLRLPVRFAEGMANLHAYGARRFLELGPRHTLVNLGRSCVPEDKSIWVPSLRKGEDDRWTILTSLAQLYVTGAKVDWNGFHAPFGRRIVSLPPYPFERKRYWVDTLPHGGEAGAKSPVPAGSEPAPRLYAPTAQAQGEGGHEPKPATPPLAFRISATHPPQTPTERRLAELWCTTLGVNSVDTTDNFFRSGGDSILVTRLAARIPELFGVEVPLSTVLQSPTFGDLARTIDEIKTAERAEPTYELKPINRTSAARRQIQSSKGDHRDR